MTDERSLKKSDASAKRNGVQKGCCANQPLGWGEEGGREERRVMHCGSGMEGELDGCRVASCYGYVDTVELWPTYTLRNVSR